MGIFFCVLFFLRIMHTPYILVSYMVQSHAALYLFGEFHFQGLYLTLMLLVDYPRFTSIHQNHLHHSHHHMKLKLCFFPNHLLGFCVLYQPYFDTYVAYYQYLYLCCSWHRSIDSWSGSLALQFITFITWLVLSLLWFWRRTFLYCISELI